MSPRGSDARPHHYCSGTMNTTRVRVVVHEYLKIVINYKIIKY